jgi:cytochrome c oxidase cbb3-type subunit 1
MTFRELSLTYIATAVGLLLLAGLSGAFGGLAILNGGMLGPIPGSMFISMHLSLGNLGWVIFALIGLYLGICYLTDREITYGYKWFKGIYWLYLAGIITAVVMIAYGYGNEKRYGETTWPFALLLMAALIMCLILIINLFRQTGKTREISVYYFIVSWFFIILYFGVIALPLAGIYHAIALSISTHLLFDGMMIAIMGLNLYILPKIVGRPIYSEMLAIIKLWMAFMMMGLTSSRHVVRLEIMPEATQFWAFFYNALAAAFICLHFFNIYMTIRGARPQEYKLSFWALILSNIYLAIVAFQGLGFLFMTIYHGQHAPKMLITLHAHFALFGFVTLGLVGALFYVLPKLIEGFKVSNKLDKGIFYTLNGGMLLAFTATALKNIAPADAHAGDNLTAEALQTYYLSAQYVGDTFLLVASFLIGWTIFKNMAGVKLPLKRLAAAAMLAVGLILGNWWPAPFNPALAQAEGPIVAVANEGDGTVSILNGTDGKVIRMLKTGGNPHNVNFDPLGRYLWVTDHSAEGRLLGYSLRNFKLVAEIPLAGAAGHVVPGYDGRYLYVSVEGANRVAVVDTESFQVTAEITTDIMPHGLVISGDESVMLVPNMMSDTVSVIDLSTRKLAGTAHVCTDSLRLVDFPELLQTHIHAGGGVHVHHHYLANNRNSSSQTHKDHRSEPHQSQAPAVPASSGPEVLPGHDLSLREDLTMPVAMGISIDGDKAYVSLAGTDQVAEIDVNALRVTRVVDLPGRGELGPIQLPVHPNGKFLYVPSMSEGKVFKIELARFQVVGEIATGAGAHGIAFSHGGRYAYVTNTYDNTVACIDTTLDKVVFVEAVGIAPNGVAVLKGKNQGW